MDIAPVNSGYCLARELALGGRLHVHAWAKHIFRRRMANSALRNWRVDSHPHFRNLDRTAAVSARTDYVDSHLRFAFASWRSTNSVSARLPTQLMLRSMLVQTRSSRSRSDGDSITVIGF